MKRMEIRIALTFAIMLVVGTSIYGFITIISNNCKMNALSILENVLISAMCYLGYIWLNTRRYKILTIISVISIFLILLFSIYDTGEVTNYVFDWKWTNIIIIIYYLISFVIAHYQAKELLKEERRKKRRKKSNKDF